MRGIERAILSCHDKSGIVEFAHALREFDVDIISTTGTLRELEKAGIEAASISDFTGVREMMDGRVKSLHPKVHAGLLGVRGNKVHEEEMEAAGFRWIDLVVVNLHSIDTILSQTSVALDEVVEQIDIGGLAMIRSAAKNFRYVTVVTSPRWYKTVIHELRAHDGRIPFSTRFRLACEAFECTAAYDRRLAEFLEAQEPAED